MSDGIQRRCPKCDNTAIQGPFYVQEDNRLRLVCRCGYFWTTPTKDHTLRDLITAQSDRTKND